MKKLFNLALLSLFWATPAFADPAWEAELKNRLDRYNLDNLPPIANDADFEVTAQDAKYLGCKRIFLQKGSSANQYPSCFSTLMLGVEDLSLRNIANLAGIELDFLDNLSLDLAVPALKNVPLKDLIANSEDLANLDINNFQLSGTEWSRYVSSYRNTLGDLAKIEVIGDLPIPEKVLQRTLAGNMPEIMNATVKELGLGEFPSSEIIGLGQIPLGNAVTIGNLGGIYIPKDATFLGAKESQIGTNNHQGLVISGSNRQPNKPCANDCEYLEFNDDSVTIAGTKEEAKGGRGTIGVIISDASNLTEPVGEELPYIRIGKFRVKQVYTNIFQKEGKATENISLSPCWHVPFVGEQCLPHIVGPIALNEIAEGERKNRALLPTKLLVKTNPINPSNPLNKVVAQGKKLTESLPSNAIDSVEKQISSFDSILQDLDLDRKLEELPKNEREQIIEIAKTETEGYSVDPATIKILSCFSTGECVKSIGKYQLLSTNSAVRKQILDREDYVLPNGSRVTGEDFVKAISSKDMPSIVEDLITYFLPESTQKEIALALNIEYQLQGISSERGNLYGTNNKYYE